MNGIRVGRAWRWGLVGILALLLMGFGSTPKHYSDLTFPPLPQVALPAYEHYALGNGLTVYLMEDHELPLVSGVLLFRSGERLTSAAQVGLAEMTGEVMRLGGTRRQRPEQINQRLEARAAILESGISDTVGSVNFSCLSEDWPEVFELFAGVAQDPAFESRQVELARSQLRGAIARRNDDPEGIAQREFLKLVYGDDSPYARTIESSTVAQIARADLVRFHRQTARPDGAILGLIGDIDPDRARALVAQHFDSWASPDPLPSPPPDPTRPQRRGVFLVDQPQRTQSVVRMGHLGGRVEDPSYPALAVLNGVLNGLSGRLFNEIRSRQGLAYSVYAAWSPEYDHPGVFAAGGQTRSETTVPFIQSLRQEIDRIRTAPISEAELARAKDATLNAFVFNFQDPGQTLGRLLLYQYYGYPSDSLERFRRGVEATTVAEVQRVAQSYLQPDSLAVLVVGNRAAIQPPLEQLGSAVTLLDISP